MVSSNPAPKTKRETDLSSVKRFLDDIQDQITRLYSTQKSYDDVIARLTGDIENLTKRLTDTGNKYSDLILAQTTITDNKNKIEEVKRDLNKMTVELGKLQLGLTHLTERYDGLVKKHEDMTKSDSVSYTKIDRLEQAMESIKSELNELDSVIAGLTSSLTNVTDLVNATKASASTMRTIVLAFMGVISLIATLLTIFKDTISK